METHLECQQPTSADMKAFQETIVCHESTETDAEKIQYDPRMVQSVAEHQEVLKKNAEMKAVKGRKKLHWGTKQSAGRRGEPKVLTQGDCGSQRKLATACRKVSLRATVAWNRGTFSGKLEPAEIVDRSTNWPPSES
jgi:glucosamine 6-phosphate synthetase-like amidotransferase/phosphosugar isomerase protein